MLDNNNCDTTVVASGLGGRTKKIGREILGLKASLEIQLNDLRNSFVPKVQRRGCAEREN